MKQIIENLELLRQYTGNDQLYQLRCVRSDLLKQVLEYTFDTHRKYKIDEGKYNKVEVTEPETKLELTKQYWNVFTTMLDELAEVKSAKDTHVATIKSFIKQFNEWQFLEQVLFKDLKLGMKSKKIQTVWPDFCVVYPYMGCRPFNMKNLENIPYPAYAQTKMDGSFCNVIVDLQNKKIEYISRQSKPQPMSGSLDEELLSICPIDDVHFTKKFVLTGEVLVWDSIDDKPLPRKISNGILRRQDKTPEELASIHFVCWDFLPYENFVNKKWDVPYSDRYNWLKTRISNSKRIHIVNTWTVNNVDEAMAVFNEQYEKGEEGVVIKSLTQPWVDGKPAGQVKIKAEKTCELRMVEFIEGKGMYSGMCGSIRCVCFENKLEVCIKPRTPEDAKLLWNNKDTYLNKIVEVKFNEVIESDTKELPSLYLPVFVEIRTDKALPDTYEQIKAL